MSRHECIIRDGLFYIIVLKDNKNTKAIVRQDILTFFLWQWHNISKSNQIIYKSQSNRTGNVHLICKVLLPKTRSNRIGIWLMLF